MKQDRFLLPSASIVTSKTGKLSYGLPDRLCLRMIPPPPSKAPKTPELWTPRQPRRVIKDCIVSLGSAPSGNSESIIKRDQKSYPWVEALQERRRRESYTVIQNRASARCTHTAYGCRIRGDIEALSWEITDKKGFYDSGVIVGRKQHDAKERTRPETAPTLTHRAPVPTNCLDVEKRQAVFRTCTPRFEAHARAEERRATTPDPEPAKLQARLQFHAVQSQALQEKLNQLKALEKTWPHGVPVARRRSALSKGLGVVGGLGYGSGY